MGRKRFHGDGGVVSHAVLTGLLVGSAMNIAFGELVDLAGADPRGPCAAVEFGDTVAHPGRVDGASLAIGALALGLVAMLRRHGLTVLAAPSAVLVPTLIAGFARLDTVDHVSRGDVPRGVPVPRTPDPELLILALLGGALAALTIVLLRGMGPRRWRYPPRATHVVDAHRHFAARRPATIAAIPRIHTHQGPRWHEIPTGAWILVVTAGLSELFGAVAAPAMAAVLVAGAILAIRGSAVGSVWNGGAGSRIALVCVLGATVVLPIAEALIAAVVVSLLQRLDREGVDLRVRLFVLRDNALVEVVAPRRLEDGGLMLVEVCGSLRHIGAHTLETRLPRPDHAAAPTVVVRLRGRTLPGTWFLAMLAAYAARLDGMGGRLYLDGIDPGAPEFWTDAMLEHVGVTLDFLSSIVTADRPVAAQARVRVTAATASVPPRGGRTAAA